MFSRGFYCIFIKLNLLSFYWFFRYWDSFISCTRSEL